MIKSIKKLFSAQSFGILVTILGTIGLIASLILSYEKYSVALNPDRVPSCSINPIVDCGSVLESNSDALLFGVPNAFFGIAAFSALLTVGFMLFSGVKPPKWFWQLFYAGSSFGIGMVVYFVYESLYVIGSLCLYCMTTWAVVIPLFVYSTIYLVENGTLAVPKKLRKIWPTIRANHLGVVILMYLIVFGLILFRFREYFESLF